MEFQSLSRENRPSNINPWIDGKMALTFQSLSRENRPSNYGDQAARRSFTERFNPLVGKIGLQTQAKHHSWRTPTSFNPLVGKIGLQTVVFPKAFAKIPLFQSLSRENRPSNPSVAAGVPDPGWFQSLSRENRPSNDASASTQSIFCGFNPLVGKIGLQTKITGAAPKASRGFQSLSRENRPSNMYKNPILPEARMLFQSLSRENRPSNNHGHPRGWQRASFNPLVGKIGLQTRDARTRC